MDGTRSWQAVHAGPPLSRWEQVLNVSGAVRAMAFRHGYLVVVTDKLVVAYTRNGETWHERSRIADDGGRADPLTSLAVEAGWVLLLSRNRARALRLPHLTVGHDAAGGARVQAADNGVWAYADARTGRLMRGALGATVAVAAGSPLPDGAAPIWDMTMSAGSLAMAREDGVWLADAASDVWRLERLPWEGSSWRRVLWLGHRLFALGADEGGIKLAWADQHTGASDERRFDGAYVPDMASAGGSILLVQKSHLERYPAEQPTQQGERVGIPTGWAPRRIAAALEHGGAIAALMVARQANTYRLQHVALAGGQCSPVGITMSSEPVVCLAGGLLVVSSLEGAASRIWSYPTE